MSEEDAKDKPGIEPVAATDAPAQGSEPSAHPGEPSPLEEAAAAAAEREAARLHEEEAANAEREDAEDDPEEVIPEVVEPKGKRRWIPLVLAALLPLVIFFFLPPLAKSGLWDPYELNVADLGRRVAIHCDLSSCQEETPVVDEHRASGDALVLNGADNTLPHLNDLGRPQLPFTSIALGFKMFGLHEWAGRMPLAIWGLLGVLATYAFMARLFDRKTGLYSAAALTTMPLYFVQARSMLGDICTMSALAMAFGGLAVTVFDRDERGPTSALARLPWLAMAAVGLVAGFESRGAVLGLGVPLVGVGAAWAVSWAAGKRKVDWIGDAIGFLGLGAGITMFALGAAALAADVPTGKDQNLNLIVGAMLKSQPRYPTFDYYIGAIGHGLAPWSAFIPFALARLFVSPVGRAGALFQRESAARTAIMVGAAAAFLAHGYLAPRVDLMAFCGVPVLAAACGIAIRDFERGAHASVAVGVGTLFFSAMFHHDFHEVPDKAYQAFAIAGAPFPETYKPTALTLWWVVLGGFAVIAFLTWVERDSKRTPFDPANYAKIIQNLREAFDGLLALAYLAIVAGASLAALFVWVGVKTKAPWLPSMSLLVRDIVLNAWWVLAFVPLGGIFACLFACDLWLFTFNRSRGISFAGLGRGFEPFEDLVRRIRAALTWETVLGLGLVVLLMGFAIPGMVLVVLIKGLAVKTVPAVAIALPSGIGAFVLLAIIGDLLRHRAGGLVLAGVVVGGTLSFAYYPALANQLSPKEVFESFQKVHKGSEPLALLGVGSRTAAYYAGGQPDSFHDPVAGFSWLRGAESGRRFLATSADFLPKLNQLYRQAVEPRENLPVLDARSSQILLAASSLAEGEKNDNPLNKIILASLPTPHRPLDVVLEDGNTKQAVLDVLGIDIAEPNGTKVDAVAPGKKYLMRTYFRVRGAITTEWEAFIHIDGNRKRHNGDHKPMGGKYPMSLWLVGDLLVDEYEFALEPNFTPGDYTIYFGLYVGDSRLKVQSGPSDKDNRIDGGKLRVQ